MSHSLGISIHLANHKPLNITLYTAGHLNAFHQLSHALRKTHAYLAFSKVTALMRLRIDIYLHAALIFSTTSTTGRVLCCVASPRTSRLAKLCLFSLAINIIQLQPLQHCQATRGRARCSYWCDYTSSTSWIWIDTHITLLLYIISATPFMCNTTWYDHLHKVD